MRRSISIENTSFSYSRFGNSMLDLKTDFTSKTLIILNSEIEITLEHETPLRESYCTQNFLKPTQTFESEVSI